MTTPRRISRRSFMGLTGATVGAVALGGCGSDAQGGGTVTLDWWHIANTEPMLSVWAEAAKAYEQAHPNVKIDITPLENEAFKAKLTTVTQAGAPPDIFHTWGGGVLKQQVTAHLVQELTTATSPWIDGKTYGIPFDIGMVGFWYNKELFARAGVSAPPATWADFLRVVGQLKAAGITPIALAGADKWPGHYYWAYLAMRVAGLGALKQAAVDGGFDGQDFVAAGKHLKELVDLAPFQKGFLAATYSSPDGQAATMGNAQAAMELMGQWAPAVQNSSSTTKGGLGDKLGFFPFPVVNGGKGTATDAFGGGGGFAVGRNAPPEALDVVKFLVDVANQRKAAATGAVLPVAKGAEDAIKDSNLATVSKTLSSATGFQLFLDQAYAPAVGQQVNDSVAELIAGTASPEQVAQVIAKTAKSQ